MIIAISILLFHNCKEEKSLMPLDAEMDSPAMVSNVNVENLPGAVKISYRLPNDPKLLYVKAECLINGKITQVKASSYINELLIEGFDKVGEYEVKLYSVSKSESVSEPLIVQVTPETPPYENVFASLTLDETFGGASVSFKNPVEAELVFEILAQDDKGDWVVAETYYTKRSEGVLSARGFPSLKRKFGVHIKDRWNNRTDTIIHELTPIFEKQIDRTKFQPVLLPTDQPAAWGWVMPNIWDGIIVNNTNVDKPGFHTNPAEGEWPQWFTFSLGTESKLSRFKFWQRGSYVAFTDRNIKKFEIWGSNEPAIDGSWDTWTKLLDGESVKPSGLPIGQNSAEDIALVGAGEEFIFPNDTPSVKFIRIKVLQTWSGAESFYVMQVAFWGADAD